ncbi:helix-turn-helix domain-containing protein [Arthrobacter sp. UYCu723]
MAAESVGLNPALVHFGAMVRSVRLESKMRGQDLAKATYLSQATISKIETGKYRILEPSELKQLILALTCGEEMAQQLRQQWSLAQLDPSSFAFMLKHGPDAAQRRLASLESTASRIYVYECAVFPGLLQTRTYSEALFRDIGHAAAAAGRLAQARMERQYILSQPKNFTFVMSEAALFSLHGTSDKQVLTDQISHAIRISWQRNIDIRILTTRGGSPSVAANPFMIIDNRYVSAEAAISEQETTNTGEVIEYHGVFRRLYEAAIDDVQSRTLLQSVLDDSATIGR